MSSITHTRSTLVNRSVSRVPTGSTTWRDRLPHLDSAKVLAGMLILAVGGAMAVLVDDAINGWVENELLAAWAALWVVIFSGLAWVAPSFRAAIGSALARWNKFRLERARAVADERLWELARRDHRVMAEIKAAIGRFED